MSKLVVQQVARRDERADEDAQERRNLAFPAATKWQAAAETRPLPDTDAIELRAVEAEDEEQFGDAYNKDHDLDSSHPSWSSERTPPEFRMSSEEVRRICEREDRLHKAECEQER